MTYFNSKVAQIVGTNAAVIAQYFWEISDRTWNNEVYNEKYNRHGYHWIRCSRKKLTGLFPFLTVGQVDSAI